jgi:hypothetical protein
MIAGAEDIIDLQLLRIRFLAVEADLPPPLKRLATAPDHCIVRIRQRMIKLIPLEVL